MKSFFVASVILAGLAAPVFAGECPSLIQKAEEAMNAATLDEAMKMKVMDHIAQAKTEHEAGKHNESIVTINDALQLIGA
jgi:archaellin